MFHLRLEWFKIISGNRQGKPMRFRVRRFAHVLERVGLAMAGAACGLFVSAHVCSTIGALTSQGFLVVMMILGAIAFIQSVDVNGGVAATTHLGGMLVGYIYLQGGRGGWAAEIKYRYLKWKINRVRKKFDVYSGGRADDWDRRVH